MDSANMQSLVELFHQYGYINEDNAGELYASTIELVFIHNSKTRDAELPFDIVESIGFRTIGVHISFQQLAEAPLPSSRCFTTLYPPNLLLPSYWIFPCLRSSAMQRSMVLDEKLVWAEISVDLHSGCSFIYLKTSSILSCEGRIGFRFFRSWLDDFFTFFNPFAARRWSIICSVT